MRTLFLAAVFAGVSAFASAHDFPPVPAACGTVGTSGRGGDFCNYSATKMFWQYPADPLPQLWTQAPTTEKTVKNGVRQLAGTGNDTFWIAHLYSDTDNMTEMGYALGSLFPGEMSSMLVNFEKHLADWVDKKYVAGLLPKWFAQKVVEFGADIALDFVYDITKKYIPQEIKDEWEGIVAGCNAHGGNCTITSFRHLFLIPQLTKAACTIFTAHNSATKGGHALHLRALDFECNTGVADWSSITIFHFKKRPQYANFLYLGLQGGTFTGMSYNPTTNAVMTVSEKAWGGGHTTDLPSGLPWMTMLRNALLLSGPDQVTQYIEGVSKASSPTPNHISIHAGFTFGTYNKPNGATDDSIAFEVGYNFSHKFKWNTQGTHGGRTPQLRDQVYFLKNGSPHTQCARDMMLGTASTAGMYGNYTADYFARYWTSADMTGDTQVVGWDLTGLKAIVANSRKTWCTAGTCCAYHRMRTEVDMKAMFDLPAPNV